MSCFGSCCRDHLDNCLTFGKLLLIENILEDLHLALAPVLEGRLGRTGDGVVLPVGDEEVGFYETFRSFITTRLLNPHHSSELSGKVLLLI